MFLDKKHRTSYLGNHIILASHCGKLYIGYLKCGIHNAKQPGDTDEDFLDHVRHQACLDTIDQAVEPINLTRSVQYFDNCDTSGLLEQRREEAAEKPRQHLPGPGICGVEVQFGCHCIKLQVIGKGVNLLLVL